MNDYTKFIDTVYKNNYINSILKVAQVTTDKDFLDILLSAINLRIIELENFNWGDKKVIDERIQYLKLLASKLSSINDMAIFL